MYANGLRDHLCSREGRRFGNRGALALAVVLLASGGRAHASDVLPGVDLFYTPPGATSFDTSLIPGGEIPAHFFDPGSDPFIGSIPLLGVPLVTAPPNVISPTDTIVERLATAILPNQCGDVATIPIELLALSLTSAGPITVTYFGGVNPELWDVEVSAPPPFQSAPFQNPPGTMTINHECPAGGTFTATLPVSPQVTFVRQSDNATRVLGAGLLTIPMMTVNGHWTHSDPGFGIITGVPGIVVDMNGDGLPDPPAMPPSSNFFPGLRALPCECPAPPQMPPPVDVYVPRGVLEEKPGGGAQHYPIPGIPQPCSDPDGDFWCDPFDNCPLTPNPDQADSDDDTVGDACDPRDHFQCYETKRAAFPTTPVTVIDQFGTIQQDLRFPHRLCAPADKNGEGIEDDVQHLTGYELRRRSPVKRVRDQTLVNQFGTLRLDVTRPQFLFVPTAKNAVPLPPDTIDHFQCYKVKRSRGAPKFTRVTATVSSQFESVTLDLLRPFLLCAPANKNGEDPVAPFKPDHLLCYKTRSRSRFAGDFYDIQNQFGASTVRLINRRELCVPSLKNPPSTTTTTTTTTTSTTTTTLYGSPSRAFLAPPGSLLD